MTGALIPVHRWLGVACCLFFAMWFATGIVMHFVPFPALTDAAWFDGLAPIDRSRVTQPPAAAVRASGLEGALRVRLLQRSDGPVYVVSAASVSKALHADDLTDAAVSSAELASTIAKDYARRRGFDVSRASGAEIQWADQWSVAGNFDHDRPLYRIPLNDALGTELYISSASGQVVLSTARRERWLNYVGSIAHWIYPVVLRSNPKLWSAVVWALALASLVAAVAGAILGLTRLRWRRLGPVSPYAGLRAWHHWLGLTAMAFVLTWIFSGWLSVDNGWFFSTGRPSPADAVTTAGKPAWELLGDEVKRVTPSAREVEWFAFGGEMFRRERFVSNDQILMPIGAAAVGTTRHFLAAGEVSSAIGRLTIGCGSPTVVGANDFYPAVSSITGTPVYRVACGSLWFDVDGANGAIIEKLDSSRRAHRWLYRALHTFDFPGLTARPALRSVVILGFCAWGFVFSITGVLMSWKRLQRAKD